MTYVVENSRLRVTLPQKEWRAIVEAESWRAERNKQTPESWARGIVLSRAMAAIGHKSEAAQPAPAPFGEQSVRQEAERLALLDEVENSLCPYDPSDLLMRHMSGRIMSDGQRRALAEMQDRAQARVEDFMDAARQSLKLAADREQAYHERRAALGGWQVDVIGEMPGRIGMCDYAGV